MRAFECSFYLCVHLHCCDGVQETKKVLDEYLAKRKAKKGVSVEGAPVEEKSTLHGTLALLRTVLII